MKPLLLLAAAWRILGPGGGGAQFHPTVSPHSPATALVACDMTGAYLTRDGGVSWRIFDLGGVVNLFAFDPADARVMYASTGALYRSTDGGQRWQLVFPGPDAIRSVNTGDDHAEQKIAGRVTALAIDPADSHSLYAAIRAGSATALWHSSDWGSRWQKAADLPGGARSMWLDPRSGALYVAGATAVTVRQDGKWRTGASLGPIGDISAGFPASGPAVFYATSKERIFVSEDGGMTWRQSPLPGLQGSAGAIATSLFEPDVAYVSYSGLRTPLHATFGVARTSDRGRHWDLVWQEPGAPAANIHDAWLSPLFGPGWAGNPLGIGVAPHDPNTVYTTDSGRTMRTTDGGKTWEAVYSNRAPEGGWTTRGLDVTTCYGVHFDPFDARHVFISYTDIGLFASQDGGASWSSAIRGVPGNWANTTYWMEFDPRVRGRAWAAMSGTHDLPRPKMWRARSPESYTGGVAATDDGGRTWRASNQGMPETAVTHILLDPASAEGARVLYATGFGRGVYKSIDGGRHWALKNSGLEGSQPFAWRLARDSQGALYLVVARRNDDGSFGNPGDGALYRSTDGAEHWTLLRLPPGVNGPNGIAVDPQDPRRLYLAAWGRSTPEGAVDGGIFLSTDGGSTWRNVLAQDQHVYDVTVDPRDPLVLYAAGFESAAWSSTDRGLTWQRIPGFDFKWGHRVIPDPLDAALVYITTFGGSVWHGPAR